ncbi:membrane protein insertase YidC [Candidatus Pelagibacter sp.]|uniref:membrane protein insertase YidC n=1 Tax=Candidatus Pelagibacter sp. TaxID=2024849 RepID=UPI003F84BD89
MDQKNTIAAIALSSAIIVLWALFMTPDKPSKEQVLAEKDKIQNAETPEIERTEIIKEISREQALQESERVLFENENIKGSISLTGGQIDDLEFKKFKKTQDGEENVILLNPRKSKDGYYVETGWAISNKNIDVPNSKSIWTVEGNKKLTINTPIKLVWSNDQNLKFEKEISIDDKYLFTIKQSIKNNTNKIYNFYPYGQIVRNKIPEITNFFILHEGPLGVFSTSDGNTELVEKDYDDIQDKSFSINADAGFLGITDKFWITTILPQKNSKFRANFDFKNKFLTNFIETEATEIGANETKSNEIKILLAAKEVKVIDQYSEQLNIEKLDLIIDWGILYWLTRPMWSALDFFYQLLGNYGLAIIAVTICTRILLFPLAQLSFKSMSRMKLLTPEIERIKNLHKDDKKKIQVEMMELYRREKINPMSGCLPLIPMIFLFFCLYKVLFVTIDSRFKGFYGYLTDLSSRDPSSLFNLFGLINWTPPDFLLIGWLPLFFGLSMWAQQKLNPPPSDPMQKKLFAFFPLLLTVILAPFPSGLLLYWCTNNILQMGQQYLVLRMTKVKTT